MRSTLGAVGLLAAILGGCATCEDLAAEERRLTAPAACRTDADCQLVMVGGCQVMCGVAVASSTDAAALRARLSELRDDANGIGCSCPIARCAPATGAACVAGTCAVVR